jgi:hypothetical protein
MEETKPSLLQRNKPTRRRVTVGNPATTTTSTRPQIRLYIAASKASL